MHSLDLLSELLAVVQRDVPAAQARHAHRRVLRPVAARTVPVLAGPESLAGAARALQDAGRRPAAPVPRPRFAVEQRRHLGEADAEVAGC